MFVSDEDYRAALLVIGHYVKQKAHEVVPDGDPDAIRDADILPDIWETISIDLDGAIEEAIAGPKIVDMAIVVLDTSLLGDVHSITLPDEKN